MSRPTFQEQVFLVREEAIVAAVNRQLAEKGFDQMTVDAIAAEVGIGKASLYKHFASKEELAAAAMASVLDGALEHARQLDAQASLDDFERLQAMATWAVWRQIRGEMPALPAQNPTLREAMRMHSGYMDRLLQLSEHLGRWIESARAAERLDATLPPEFTLYTLLAKGCDPVVLILKEAGQHTDEAIVSWAVRACFAGLGATGTGAAGPPDTGRR